MSFCKKNSIDSCVPKYTATGDFLGCPIVEKFTNSVFKEVDNIPHARCVEKFTDTTAENTGIAKNCWKRLPTGCNKNLSETTTPKTWFIDTRQQSAVNCAKRSVAFNKYCGKTDTQSQFVVNNPDSQIPAKSTGIPHCWKKLPTGCNKKLSETKTPEQWFLDAPEKNIDTCTNRTSAFNSYCGRRDTESQFVVNQPDTPEEAATKAAVQAAADKATVQAAADKAAVQAAADKAAVQAAADKATVQSKVDTCKKEVNGLWRCSFTDETSLYYIKRLFVGKTIKFI